MTNASSIDSAANAYVRHRFVRAFAASYWVASVFGVMLTLVGATVYALFRNFAQLWTVPLGVMLALVVIGVFVAGIGMLCAFADMLHRRLSGALLFALAIYIVVIAGGGALTSMLMLIGVDMGLPLSDAPWLGLLGILGAAIAYEAARHAWWQMTAPRPHFLAVRGWRPPLWRVLTTLRRLLGLPAFLAYVGRNRARASLLYFGVAVLNVGLIMLLILPTMFASMTEFDNPFALGGALLLMFGLLAANLLGAGNIIACRADARATALYQNVREWDARAPIVFLRSFNQDDRRLPVTGGDAFARWPAGISRSRTLDELLLEHGSPYGPVIAIGDPRDPVPPLGAARVFVPERGNGWQDVVRGLVDASKCVVMCPNTGAGVQWELDLIASSAARVNVIFLASPELTRADTLALFRRLVPNLPDIAADQTPIAAYAEQGREWRVLTAKTLTLNAYTAALNSSLQALFGLEGVALPQNKRPQPEAGALNVEAAKAA
ncbi:MAG: hypothetical protein AB7G40_03510 [Hyphomonadaceae bacterium]